MPTSVAFRETIENNIRNTRHCLDSVRIMGNGCFIVFVVMGRLKDFDRLVIIVVFGGVETIGGDNCRIYDCNQFNCSQMILGCIGYFCGQRFRKGYKRIEKNLENFQL
jgi:hypothetical protein